MDGSVACFSLTVVAEPTRSSSSADRTGRVPSAGGARGGQFPEASDVRRKIRARCAPQGRPVRSCPLPPPGRPVRSHPVARAASVDWVAESRSGYVFFPEWLWSWGIEFALLQDLAKGVCLGYLRYGEHRVLGIGNLMCR